ncbi:hypothetical protein BS17DRAFT_769318 [Gyrodon lividus]|nr:hypothetical protein BS17DRAFT_769318 [Gyrodon lividus]
MCKVKKVVKIDIKHCSRVWMGPLMDANGNYCEFEEQGGLRNEDQDVDNARVIVSRAYETRLYNDWVKAVPGFSDLVTKFETDPDALNDLIDMMGTAANGGRTDDTGSLKFDGLNYMLKDPTKDKIEPPIPRTRHSTKADRGWNNQTIARLLCPARNVWEFDLDPLAYMDLVRSGDRKKKPTATKFPSLLYDMTVFDPEKNVMDFFTWRHIFTGPVFAFNKTRCAAKPSKGRIHGFQEPNIRNIMYVAVQIYYTMSTEESWTSMISTVNLADMFYAIVELVEQKSDEQWVKDLMEFWKNEAPGLVVGGPSKHRKTVANPGNSDLEDDLAGFEDNPPSPNTRQCCAIARPPMGSGPAHNDNGNDCDGNNLRNGDTNANSNTEPEENASSTRERSMSFLTPPPGSPLLDGPGTLGHLLN